jgi:hypothetical protein
LKVNPDLFAVRMSPEGTLYIQGRIDSQIKLRGVRIESDGVSEIIRKAAKERVSAYTLISGRSDLGSESLVSFFARDDSSITVDKKHARVPEIMYGGTESLDDIRRHINKELPVYMRPAHLIPVEFLPLTLNGKIDGKKLISVFAEVPLQKLMSLQNSSSAGSTPREVNPVESLVIACASEICGIPETDLSPISNLFECGFDSLKFNVLTRQLRRQLSNLSLSVADIMGAPVVDAIARLCQSAPTKGHVFDSAWAKKFELRHRVAVEASFAPEEVQSILPSLPIQDGILAQSLRSKELYVQNFLYRLKEGVDLDHLRASWSKLVARQEILRFVHPLRPSMCKELSPTFQSSFSTRIGDPAGRTST